MYDLYDFLIMVW